MKYVYTCVAFFILLLAVYAKGMADGKNKAIAGSLQAVESQLVAISQNTKQTLDFQRIISNNNDECFNRVWDDETVGAVNPQLRWYDNLR